MLHVIVNGKLMQDLVKTYFGEWTKGKDLRESLTSIFEHVRDIPYAVIPHIRNFSDGPREILKCMKGSCTPKHFLLGSMFEKLGVNVRYVTFPYYWLQAKLHYSVELMELCKGIPIEYHLACQVHIDDKWILVDATWDLPLEKIGASVNKNWDGFSNLMIAVDYQDMIIHETAQERDAYVQKKKLTWSSDDLARENRFIEALNLWLEEVRA